MYRDEKPAHPLAHLAFPFSKAVEYQANIFRAAQDLQAFLETICRIQDKSPSGHSPVFTCTPFTKYNFNEKKGFRLKWSYGSDASYEARITAYGSGRLSIKFEKLTTQLTLGHTQNFDYDLDPKEPYAELTIRMINMVSSAHPDIQNLVRRNQQAFLDEIGSNMVVQPLGDPKPSIA